MTVLHGVLFLTLAFGDVALAVSDFNKANNAVDGYVSGTSDSDFAKPPRPPDEDTIVEPGRAGPEGGPAGGNGGTAGARGGNAGFPQPPASVPAPRAAIPVPPAAVPTPPVVPH